MKITRAIRRAIRRALWRLLTGDRAAKAREAAAWARVQYLFDELGRRAAENEAELAELDRRLGIE